MRKWMVAGAVVVVLAGGGYLGAQAYSSQRFDDEVGKLVARMNASPAWQVTREGVDAGWFRSSGRIEATYLDAPDDEPLVVEMPYHADHGLLETTLNGDGQVHVGDRTLFGDLLQSDESLTWQGRFLTRERKLEARIEMPAVSRQVTLPASEIDGEVTPPREMQLEFGGLTLDLTQAGDEVTLDGTAPRLRMADSQADVRVDGMTLTGHFQGDREAFDQSLTLTLPTTTVTPNGSPDVVTRNLVYAVKATLDAEQLETHLSADFGETRVQDQKLFGGGLEMTLDHVDGDAYRALATALDRHWGGIQAAIDSEDADALRQALVPLQPAFHDILASSPRLSLDGLNADSPLLGMKMEGSGELRFDGDGLEARELQTLQPPELESELLQRLEGQLTLKGAPPLLSMYLGLPLTSDPLELSLADGVLEINGQSLPLLSPQPVD